jgi:hypothetical protein
METTSTSSSLPNTIPIPTEQSIEYLNSLKVHLLELQRRIQQYNSLGTSRTSLSITSVTVSEDSLNLY